MHRAEAELMRRSMEPLLYQHGGADVYVPALSGASRRAHTTEHLLISSFLCLDFSPQIEDGRTLSPLTGSVVVRYREEW